MRMIQVADEVVENSPKLTSDSDVVWGAIRAQFVEFAETARKSRKFLGGVMKAADVSKWGLAEKTTAWSMKSS